MGVPDAGSVLPPYNRAQCRQVLLGAGELGPSRASRRCPTRVPRERPSRHCTRSWWGSATRRLPSLSSPQARPPSSQASTGMQRGFYIQACAACMSSKCSFRTTCKGCALCCGSAPALCKACANTCNCWAAECAKGSQMHNAHTEGSSSLLRGWAEEGTTRRGRSSSEPVADAGGQRSFGTWLQMAVVQVNAQNALNTKMKTKPNVKECS